MINPRDIETVEDALLVNAEPLNLDPIYLLGTLLGCQKGPPAAISFRAFPPSLERARPIIDDRGRDADTSRPVKVMRVFRNTATFVTAYPRVDATEEEITDELTRRGGYREYVPE